MKNTYTNFCIRYIDIIQKQYGTIINFKVNDNGFIFMYNNIELPVSGANFKDILYLEITDKIEGNFDKIIVNELIKLLKIV